MTRRLERIVKKHWFPEYMDLDPAGQLSILRERIKSLLPPSPDGRQRLILVTSSVLSPDELNDQCQKLAEAMASPDQAQATCPDQAQAACPDQAQATWRFVAAESVNQSATLIPLAAQADGCLIFEQQERSLYPQIDRQLVQLKDLGIRILGFVYLYGVS